MFQHKLRISVLCVQFIIHKRFDSQFCSCLLIDINEMKYTYLPQTHTILFSCVIDLFNLSTWSLMLHTIIFLFPGSLQVQCFLWNIGASHLKPLKISLVLGMLITCTLLSIILWIILLLYIAQKCVIDVGPLNILLQIETFSSKL